MIILVITLFVICVFTLVDVNCCFVVLSYCNKKEKPLKE